MTVRELLRKSMLLIGAVSTGENLSADEASDGLNSLNDLLDSWSTDGLLIPAMVREEFTLVPAQASYTIGPSGNFNTTNPMEIEEARLLITSATPNFEMPLQIYNVQEYADITQKNIQTSLPEAIYFQRGAPLSTIYLYTVPAATNKLVLYSRKALSNFATVNDTINLPPGYQRALRYNLAIELAVEYGKQPSDYVMMTSQELKAQLMRVNLDPIYMKSDVVGVIQDSKKPFNIYTGE
jgi:hypothetical protein